MRFPYILVGVLPGFRQARSRKRGGATISVVEEVTLRVVYGMAGKQIQSELLLHLGRKINFSNLGRSAPAAR